MVTTHPAKKSHMNSSTKFIERPSYISILLCAVKPAAVSSLQMLETDELLRLDWVPPSGLVPDHCLEYEVESNVMMKDGKEKEVSYIIVILSVPLKLNDKKINLYLKYYK